MSCRRTEVERLVDAVLRRPGWRYRRGRGGHGVLYPPDRARRPIPVSYSPGSDAAIVALRQKIRAAGGL